MEWRLVPIERIEPRHAVALEEVLLKKTAKDQTPIIRFWEWKDRCVTLGRFQEVKKEVDLRLCRKKEIAVIRRPSGGGTMYHSPGDEIVYSIIAPKGIFPNDIGIIYQSLCTHIMSALKKMGVDSDFVRPNNVMVSNSKISGSAQRITGQAILQHGTILYSPDREDMFSVIRKNDSPGKYILSNMTPVIGVSELTNISFDEFYSVIKEEFLEGKEFFTKRPSAEEVEKAEHLVDERYARDGWNLIP